MQGTALSGHASSREGAGAGSTRTKLHPRTRDRRGKAPRQTKADQDPKCPPPQGSDDILRQTEIVACRRVGFTGSVEKILRRHRRPRNSRLAKTRTLQETQTEYTCQYPVCSQREWCLPTSLSFMGSVASRQSKSCNHASTPSPAEYRMGVLKVSSFKVRGGELDEDANLFCFKSCMSFKDKARPVPS